MGTVLNYSSLYYLKGGIALVKKKIFTGIWFVVILWSVAILWTTNSFEYTETTGICLVTHNGIIIIVDDIPVVISNGSSVEHLFTDLQTGDKVTMTHDGVAESYPAQTGVYKLLKIDTDCIDEVPIKIITELKEMGYVVKE